MSTRSLLVSCCAYPTTPSSLLPDNGLASLAGVLMAGGHETAILDYNTVESIERLFPRATESTTSGSVPLFDHIAAKLDQEADRIAAELLDRVRRQGIRFIGFKLMTGGGFLATLKVAERLRTEFRGSTKAPKLFAGGPHVDWFGERLLERTDAFDALAYGEGEPVIWQLAEYAEGRRSLHNIPNLLFSSQGQVVRTRQERVSDLDGLPFPVYHAGSYPALQGNEKIKIIINEFSRGCPYRCGFCGHAAKSGTRWRTKSPNRIVAEMTASLLYYRIGAFRNGDSNTPPRLAMRLAERIMAQGLRVSYGLMTHVKHLRNTDLGVLKTSGCASVFLGVESGCQEILDQVMHKRCQVNEIGTTIASLKEAGIYTVTSVIVPAPGETEETKRKSLQLLAAWRPDAVPVCTPLVMPNSRWAEAPERYHIELEEDYYDQLMTYSPTLLLPPGEWKSLPYRVNGTRCDGLLQESQAFAEQLERHGILTQVCDDIAMMANRAALSPREFRDHMRACFKEGRTGEVRRMVARINA